METEVTEKRIVGDRTVALDLETPTEFEAYPGQFILIRAEINGEEETGYYTLSSADVNETFEITVDHHPDGKLGPWLADRTNGDVVTIDGPFGETTYLGETDVTALAEGPGIGPAIGIAERGLESDRDVAIVFEGESPPHHKRLEAVDSAGGTVTIVEDVGEADLESLSSRGHDAFVFGFESFVERTMERLERLGIDSDRVHVESFGPK